MALDILTASHEDVLAEIERVRVLYKFKHTMRYSSARDLSVHSESVAEHLFAMQVIAQYFYPLEDPKNSLDRVRINELMLFHELGEIETGDIINHRKTDNHRAVEKEAAYRVAANLPESLRDLAIARYEEFEAKETPEAKYAVAIDKIEPIFEMWDEQIALPLFKKQNYTHKNALEVKRTATADYPYMRKFADAWEHRALALDIFPPENSLDASKSAV